MFGKTFNSFCLFGFQVRVDLSWVLLAFLVTWSLAVGWFPAAYEGLSTETYWFMGAIGALGLFASIIVHELSHAVIACQYGMRIKGITLFVFGGVAEMEDEPPRPAAEFWMAIAGPVASILVAFLMAFLTVAGRSYGWPLWLNGTLSYLAGINLILVAFNMIPAFPLDGGRILRSALWSWKRSLRWATRVTSSIGSGFGMILIVMGILSFVTGHFISGMWWFLIGMFLRNAAQTSFQQLMIRRALEGEPVTQFIQRDVHAVGPQTTLSEFVEEKVYKHHHKLFPVLDNGRLVGCMSTRRLKDVPREEWDTTTVRDVLEYCSDENTARPDADAMKTLVRMIRNGTSRILITNGDQLQGVLSLKDLMRFISLKLEIEEDIQEKITAMPAS